MKEMMTKEIGWKNPFGGWNGKPKNNCNTLQTNLIIKNNKFLFLPKKQQPIKLNLSYLDYTPLKATLNRYFAFS
jgi:hypothetical protein